MNERELNECSAALLDRFPKWNPPEAVQRAYADLMRPYSRRVVQAAIAELWSESDKAWAEPTPAGLRKAINQTVHVGPPLTPEQKDYEVRYYAMSPRDQRRERIRALQIVVARDCFDTPTERDDTRRRLAYEEAVLRRTDVRRPADLPWPPAACAPENCGLAAAKVQGGHLCRQVRCPHLPQQRN